MDLNCWILFLLRLHRSAGTDQQTSATPTHLHLKFATIPAVTRPHDVAPEKNVGFGSGDLDVSPDWTASRIPSPHGREGQSATG